MKVASSFSVAVIVKGELWGLIACHGNKPNGIPHEIRLSCEAIASTFAVLANMMEELAAQTKRLKFEEQMKTLFRQLLSSPNHISTLFRNHTVVEEMFDATGMAYVSQERVEIAGLTPPESVARELAGFLKKLFVEQSKTVIAIESFRELDPKWEMLNELACGALAIFSPLNGDAIFMIFRPELLRTITWGGDPRKTMQKRDYQGQINPRKSFESWNQTLSGHSKLWIPYEIRGAEFFRDFVFNDLIKKERIMGELDQRMKKNLNA